MEYVLLKWRDAQSTSMVDLEKIGDLNPVDVETIGFLHTNSADKVILYNGSVEGVGMDTLTVPADWVQEIVYLKEK